MIKNKYFIVFITGLISFSSLASRDLCSRNGKDELLSSTIYPGKFFFKYDCKKRKTYFTREQARLVNDKLKFEREKAITIKLKLSHENYLVIMANQNGVIQTGKNDGIITIWNENDPRRFTHKKEGELTWK